MIGSVPRVEQTPDECLRDQVGRVRPRTDPRDMAQLICHRVVRKTCVRI